MRKHVKNSKGFTLIELMIVVVIIGILAAIAIPKFSQVSKSAKEAEAGPVLKQICTLRSSYYERYDAAPASITNLTSVGWDAASAGKYYSGYTLSAAGVATATSKATSVAANKTLDCTNVNAVVE